MAKFKRILLKLSGESLMGEQRYGIDEKRLAEYAEQIKEVHDMGVQIGIVIGGGNIFRGLSGAGKGFDRVKGDQMGMCATVINSLGLSSALGAIGVKMPRADRHPHGSPIGEFYSKWKAIECMEAGEVVIMSAGTGNPYFTTDTGSSLRGIEIEADVMLKGTRVDGVYTADPRVCPRAKKLDVISYDDMLELSSSGAGVLQMRAVEFARKYQVVIHSRSAFSDAEGTYIKEETDMMEEAVITGIAHDTSEVKFTIRGVPDMTGVAAKVFSALAGNAVSVDMIIQNISEAGITDISFTCPGADLARAKETIERILPDISARDYDVDEDIAKVSLVGTGMKSSPGVAARAFSTLGENQINILAISTSPIRLSVVVDGAQAAAAVRCLHKAFDLDSDSVFEETQLSAEEIAAKMNKGR